MISRRLWSCSASGVAEQAQKTHIELNKPRIQGIDDRPITAEGCIPISHEDDLHGKIIVIKPEVLRREYPQGYPSAQALYGRLWGFPTQQGVSLLLALTFILAKKAAMNAWTCWERYSRRTFPAGPNMALLRSSRNRPKRKRRRSVNDDDYRENAGYIITDPVMWATASLCWAFI